MYWKNVQEMLINSNLAIYNAAWLHLHIEESLMQMASSNILLML